MAGFAKALSNRGIMRRRNPLQALNEPVSLTDWRFCWKHSRRFAHRGLESIQSLRKFSCGLTGQDQWIQKPFLRKFMTAMPSMDVQLEAIVKTPGLYFWNGTFTPAQQQATNIVLQDHAFLRKNSALVTPERLQHAAYEVKRVRRNRSNAWPDDVFPQPGQATQSGWLLGNDEGQDSHPMDLWKDGNWNQEVHNDDSNDVMESGDRKSAPNKLCTLEISALPLEDVRLEQQQRQNDGWISTEKGITW